MTLRAPPLVTKLARRCRDAGGRALLVGGCVRDHLMGGEVADWDLEVHGLEETVLAEVLSGQGKVSAVGRSFGVYKLRQGPVEVDVSLPRRDSNAGPGHRGIRVVGDPHMGVTEAARRRDLTVNAILLDPLTGEVLDPWGGLDDLHDGLLRPVDPGTFLEDPLRPLRAVQFCARLGFATHPSLEDLCRAAPLGELPAERVEGEWRKLLLKGRYPTLGMALARRTAVLERLFPEAAAGDGPWVDEALERVAARPPAPASRRYAAALGAWLHRVPSAVHPTLDRLRLHRFLGYPLRDRLVAALGQLAAPATTDADLRWMSTRAEVELTLVVRRATGEPGAQNALERADALGVTRAAPQPLVLGRDLVELGCEPGPNLGRVLHVLYASQLDGELTDREATLDRAREVLLAPRAE